MVKDELKVKRALLSVYNKKDIVKLASVLVSYGIEIISTGGTHKVLREAKIPVKKIEELTNFPEILEGRVKTLHPKIYGGILASRGKKTHLESINNHNIDEIDLVVSNLYPFDEVIKRGGSREELVENIDVGGPSMIRAAAKNFSFVTVVVECCDYKDLIEELHRKKGKTSYSFRKNKSQIAFSLTASYDTLIANWMERDFEIEFPRRKSFSGKLVQQLPYGENPHQRAGLYSKLDGYEKQNVFKKIQGKDLSYNNINDFDAACDLISEFSMEDRPVVAIIKHLNPCGVGSGDTLFKAYKAALNCDRASAFGGIVVLNSSVNEELATLITETFTEMVIAPEVEDKAHSIFRKKKNLRVLTLNLKSLQFRDLMSLKEINHGFLFYQKDRGKILERDLQIVSEKIPTKSQISDLLFAWKIVKHVRSNAIVCVKDNCTVGIGAGQMSRLDSSIIAIRKSEEMQKNLGLLSKVTSGAVLASDAFFPFSDGLKEASKVGITAIIQPGGSIRDQQVIDFANLHGLVMVFTGMRHFKH